MLAKVFSGATVGLDSVLVEVEVDISEKGLPTFTIVGLPGKAVEEAKERIRSAIRNSNCKFLNTELLLILLRLIYPKKVRPMIYLWPWAFSLPTVSW